MLNRYNYPYQIYQLGPLVGPDNNIPYTPSIIGLALMALKTGDDLAREKRPFLTPFPPEFPPLEYEYIAFF